MPGGVGKVASDEKARAGQAGGQGKDEKCRDGKVNRCVVFKDGKEVSDHGRFLGVNGKGCGGAYQPGQQERSG